MPLPTRRTLVLAAAVPTVLLLAAAVAVPFRAQAAWQTMEHAVTTLQAEVTARRHPRAPLWGEAGPGNAHVHYAAARALARTLQQDHFQDLIRLFPLRDEQFANDHPALRVRWRELLAPLRAGAAATDVSRPLPAEGAAEPQVANLLDCRWVANAALFEARALRHEGRRLEAVRCTLDAATLAADLLRDGPLIDQMVGCAILAIGTSEAWPEAALAGLDRAALDELADGLARLDHSLPTTLDDRRERLFLAWHLAHATLAPGATEWLPPATAAWRFGFSTRWMLADAFLLQTARSRRLAATTDAPWAARTAALEGELAAATASGNPLVATCLPNLGAAEGSWREQLARVRLLRLAVDLHRGVEAPTLRDPIGGGPIEVLVDGDGVRLSCAAVGDRDAPRRRVVRR